MKLLLLAALLATVAGAALLNETFEDDSWEANWVLSEARKEGADADIAQYDGKWERTSDGFLKMAVPNKHYGLTRMLDEPFVFASSPVVLQYEVRFSTRVICGGAYIKLVSKSEGDAAAFDPKALHSKTPYSILFGPDRCGSDSHLRFIFTIKHPRTGKLREVHANSMEKLDVLLFKDENTPHLVTLIVRPDETFAIKLDGKTLSQGSLVSPDDFDPPLEAPATIPDPSVTKPADWVDNDKIQDPEDSKPADWDETPKIPDASAVKPDDWDESIPLTIPNPAIVVPEGWDVEEDGDFIAEHIDNPECPSRKCGPWSAPMIANPNFKGRWSPRLIPNPAFKGVWRAPEISNPEHFKESHPFAKIAPIVGVSFELWTITPGISFNNVLLTSDIDEAAQQEQAWVLAHSKDESITSFAGEILNNVVTTSQEYPLLYIAIIVGLVYIIVRSCVTTREDRDARRAVPILEGEETEDTKSANLKAIAEETEAEAKAEVEAAAADQTETETAAAKDEPAPASESPAPAAAAAAVVKEEEVAPAPVAEPEQEATPARNLRKRTNKAKASTD